MKTTNTINNTNNHNLNRVAEENLKKAIFAAAKESEPSPEQIAEDKKWCEEGAKLGRKRTVEYSERDWYKKLMENLEIAEEYNIGSGDSKIDIVESIFRLAEFEENCLFYSIYNHDERYDECIKVITDAGLKAEFDVWREQRQIRDCNGQPVRVGDIIRFPAIREVCGSPIENGYEAEVEMTDEGDVWIAYPENAWVGYDGEATEHLHIPGVPFTAELAKSAEVIIKREEGFIRHPDHGDFMFPRIHVPDSQGYQIFAKKTVRESK